MAVALDASASAVAKSGGVTTLDNGNLTVGAGSNLALVAALSMQNQGTTNTIVWDPSGANQSMTALADVALSAGGFSTRAQIFGLRAPVAGNKICRASFSSPPDNVLLFCMSFSGVNQVSDATAFPTAGRVTTSQSFAGGSGGGTLTLPITGYTVGDAVFGINSDHAGGPSSTNLTNIAGDYQNVVGLYAVYGAASSIINPMFDPGGGVTVPRSMAGIDIAALAAAPSGGGLLLLFGGSVGWTPSLVGAAALLKAGKAIRRNATLSRRKLLIGK